jgi:hypothetical protein
VRLAAGMLADFVVLDADPLEDIRHTRAVRHVEAAHVADEAMGVAVQAAPVDIGLDVLPEL